ncbi:MAG: hypothetical protein FJY29_05815 [Betaproteobacteria bacterium]|nr:hypothetical protein [Betaproteobacteria bacterium]
MRRSKLHAGRATTRGVPQKALLSLTAVAVLSALCGMGVPAQAEASTLWSGSARADKRSAMVPLRRLGVLPVAHNIPDARKSLSDQTTLRGLLAQPLSPEEFALRLNTQLKAVADASGRFWTMDAIAGEMVAGRGAAQSELSNFQKAQLVSEYDLDAWLKTEIYFTADHTAVRLAIVGTSGNNVIAREDILLPFGADWDTLTNAFAQTIGRMSDTVGHDGRVVFENNGLIGVDFGTERGVANGQKLQVGLVLQAANHPQTGEVMRYQRVTLMTLEVVDAKQGASLCRKVQFNPDLMKQAEAQFGTGAERKLPLLVWRQDGFKPDPSWQAARNEGRVDAAGMGFAARENLAASSPVRTPAASSAATSAERLPEASSQPAQVAMTSGISPFGGASLAQRDASAPGASIKIGAATAKGTLELSKGPVSSGFPSTIINQISVRDGFRYSPEWDVNYGAEYVSFTGDAEGSRITGRIGMMASGAVLAMPELPLRWGVEGQASSGTVTSSKSKKTLDALELFGVASTNRSFDGGWTLEGEFKPSMTGLLAGAFGYEFGLDVHPGMAPKGLGVQWRILDDGDRWSEWMLGVTWKLGVVE